MADTKDQSKDAIEEGANNAKPTCRGVEARRGNRLA
jgi:hypothetical protein